MLVNAFTPDQFFPFHLLLEGFSVLHVLQADTQHLEPAHVCGSASKAAVHWWLSLDDPTCVQGTVKITHSSSLQSACFVHFELLL